MSMQGEEAGVLLSPSFEFSVESSIRKTKSGQISILEPHLDIRVATSFRQTMLSMVVSKQAEVSVSYLLRELILPPRL